LVDKITVAHGRTDGVMDPSRLDLPGHDARAKCAYRLRLAMACRGAEHPVNACVRLGPRRTFASFALLKADRVGVGGQVSVFLAPTS